MFKHARTTRALIAIAAAALVCTAPVVADGARGVFESPKPAELKQRDGRSEHRIRNATKPSPTAPDTDAPEGREQPASPKPPAGQIVPGPVGEIVDDVVQPLQPADDPVDDGPSIVSTRPFSRDSFWNKPLPDDAPLDELSAVYAADLHRQVTQWGPYINTTKWGIPVYTVPRSQPTVRVALPNPRWSRARLQEAWEAVPLPADARPSPDNDHRLVVWQPSTDTMWEFFELRKELDGWHSTFGGRMTGVSKNIGTYTDPPGWGGSATGIPLLGGLMRINELRVGRIDHALALTIPEARARVYSWPASRTDGRIESATAIPEGTRFRLDPKLDISTLTVSPLVREMARAAQRYGIVVRDQGGAVAFYAEDPGPLGFDPYRGPGGIFGGFTASQLARQFPWHRLQALQTELHTEP